MGIEEIRAIKSGSESKRNGREDNNGASGNDEAYKKEKWFSERRKEMKGVCACGCGQPSSKREQNFYRHSAAHIFPKKLFKSIMFHPLNWVERRFWGGCHTNMDEGGMNKWPQMADWPDIVRKFYILDKEIPQSEKSIKFYSALKTLVENNPVL